MITKLKRKAESLIMPTAKRWLAPMDAELRRLITIAENGTPEELARAVKKAAKDAPAMYDELDHGALESTMADLQAEAVIDAITP